MTASAPIAPTTAPLSAPAPAPAKAYLHNQTPLMHSTELSRANNCNVWLKLECLQPSGSFKIRGIGNMCQKALQVHGAQTHLICSSGGNAGLATAYAGRQLGVKVTIVVPQTTSAFMKQKIEAEGARVVIKGEAWDEADLLARTLVRRDPHAVYIPPFDHPNIWQGNASMVVELHKQLGGKAPDAIICSVGGGGMLNGVLLGCQAVGWSDVPILAIETHGANSFQASVLAGRSVTLPAITSIATTLGAKRVSLKTLELAQMHPVVPFAVSDSMATRACNQFLDQHRMLVEPSCGATLSVLYAPVILQNLFPEIVASPVSSRPNEEPANVVAIVCGGSDINFEKLVAYKEMFKDQENMANVAVKSGDQIMLRMVGLTTGASSPEIGGDAKRQFLVQQQRQQQLQLQLQEQDQLALRKKMAVDEDAKSALNVMEEDEEDDEEIRKLYERETGSIASDPVDVKLEEVEEGA